MKKVLLFCAGLLLAICAFAQESAPKSIGPNKIGYQAVVRDVTNRLVSNTDNITVGVEVINEADYEHVYYAETHYPVKSNMNGLIDLLVGTGDVTYGVFDTIPWHKACFRTTITVPGHQPVVGISPITAIPYALYASNVDSLIKRIDSLEHRIDTLVIGEQGPQLECEIHLTTNGLTVTILESPIGKVDWGDGQWSAATGTEVKHTYDTSGVYTIHLYSVGVCSATKTVNLNIPACTGTKRENESGNDGAITAVKDDQGHLYNVVQIGNQCWMAENVRKTFDRVGAGMPAQRAGIDYSTYLNSDLVSPFLPRYFMINPKDSAYVYNWAAAVDMKGMLDYIVRESVGRTAYVDDFGPFSSYYGMAHMLISGGFNLDDNEFLSGNFRGICPKGWHLPTMAEFETLFSTVGCNNSSGNGYGKLAGGSLWRECDDYLEAQYNDFNNVCAESPGNYDYADRNSTFFSALPYNTVLSISGMQTDSPSSFPGFSGGLFSSAFNILFWGIDQLEGESVDFSKAFALLSIDKNYDKTSFWTRDEYVRNFTGQEVEFDFGDPENSEVKYSMSSYAKTASIVGNVKVVNSGAYSSQAEMHAVRCVRNAE